MRKRVRKKEKKKRKRVFRKANTDECTENSDCFGGIDPSNVFIF